ncbi:MAG: hypothetical protein GF364_06260 [Candidatus Lokiarchaeota archaeon]|nr:hypothetical protein [Candidatus Lokiarchaeota archaeon]
MQAYRNKSDADLDTDIKIKADDKADLKADLKADIHTNVKTDLGTNVNKKQSEDCIITMDLVRDYYEKARYHKTYGMKKAGQMTHSERFISSIIELMTDPALAVVEFEITGGWYRYTDLAMRSHIPRRNNLLTRLISFEQQMRLETSDRMICIHILSEISYLLKICRYY